MVKKIFIMLVISGTLHGMNPGIRNVAKANDFVMPAHFTPAMQVAVQNVINLGRDHLLKVVKDREIINKVLYPRKLKELDDEHTLLLNEFQNRFVKDKKEWEKFNNDVRPNMQKIINNIVDGHEAKTDDEKYIANRIKNLLSPMCLNANNQSALKILFNDNIPLIKTIYKTIVINLPDMLDTTRNADGFRASDADKLDVVILHELFHVHGNDSVYGMVLPFYKVTLHESLHDEFEKYIIRSSLFYEKRADIMAGLMDKKYALALAMFFDRHAKIENEKFPENALSTGMVTFDNRHPAHTVRANYMRQLYQEMLATIAQHS